MASTPTATCTSPAPIDPLGRRLAIAEVATTPTGYRALPDWARNLGEVEAFGVEGTGCYGAGLARVLGAQGHPVGEVNRPDPQARRQRGKSDPVDAEAAARAVLAGQVTAIPKAGSHPVEVVRCLRVARATSDQGPQPGRQRVAGAGGHRPARAPRATAGAACQQAGRHGRAIPGLARS